MVYIKVGSYHVKKNCIQYLQESEEGYIVHFGDGAHGQTVTLNKEEGMALLQVLEDLSDIA
jgi:hypothetical protein